VKLPLPCAILLAFLLIPAGCSKRRTIVGRWLHTGQNNAGPIEFKADGTYTWHVISDPRLTVYEEGSYAFDGTRLTVEPRLSTATTQKGAKSLPTKPFSNHVHVTDDEIVFDDKEVRGTIWKRVR